MIYQKGDIVRFKTKNRPDDSIGTVTEIIECENSSVFYAIKPFKSFMKHLNPNVKTVFRVNGEMELIRRKT